MSPLFHPSRSLRAAVGATLLLAAPLAVLDGHAASATPAGDAVAASDARDLDAALAQARIESEAAEAALEAAKRIATPGHLLDPLPARLMAGLGELQAEYAEMERKAAGYRATLGDQHPTLKGAEEVLAELRGQILDVARRAGATAQQDATRAQAAVASLERQARAAEVTGSIAPPVPTPHATARPAPPAQDVGASVPSPDAAPRESLEEPRASSISTPGRSLARMLAAALPLILRHPWLAAVAGLLTGGAALGLLAALFRPRRRRPPAPASIRIEPAAPVEPFLASQQPKVRRESALVAAPPVGAVPVLATLPLRAGDDPAAVLTRLERRSDAALEQGAASVFATLVAAAGLGRVGVAVTSAAGAPDALADAAALALAAAAAGVGHRVLLVDGHRDDRLGRAVAHGVAVAAIVDVDGRVRTVSRLTIGERVLAVLMRDAGTPASGRAPARLPNLDGFDAIVIAGEAASAGLVAPGLALMVAPRGARAVDLAAAARIAAGETGRPCGVLLIESVETPVADVGEASRPAELAPSRRRTAREVAPARLGKVALIDNLGSLSSKDRQGGVDESSPSRLGLRRTFEPVRRRA